MGITKFEAKLKIISSVSPEQCLTKDWDGVDVQRLPSSAKPISAPQGVALSLRTFRWRGDSHFHLLVLAPRLRRRRRRRRLYFPLFQASSHDQCPPRTERTSVICAIYVL